MGLTCTSCTSGACWFGCCAGTLGVILLIQSLAVGVGAWEQYRGGSIALLSRGTVTYKLRLCEQM